MKIFLNPYRVVFLYPQYQKIVSASNLLGFVIGLCVLYQIGYRLAANLHITPTEPLFAAPEGPVWCFYMALCFPLSLYVGMWVCAWLSALALKWKDPRLYLAAMRALRVFTSIPNSMVCTTTFLLIAAKLSNS